MLNADVVSLDVSRASSADIYRGASAAGMEAAIWFSNEMGKYPLNNTPEAPTFIPYRSVTVYDASNPTTVYVDPRTKTDALLYPIGTGDTEEYVYCVGLYPSSGWTCTNATNNNVAEYDINGSSDVMFAEQLAGSWQTPFARQQYKHLLTWLKIEARATSPDVVAHWGELQNVEVDSPSAKVSITFPQSAGNSSNIQYVGGIKSLTALDQPMNLAVTVQDAGALLLAPATSYKLRITTEKAGLREVTVKLSDDRGVPLTNELQARGKLFIINLYFSPFSDIDATCSLVPWNKQEVELN